MESFYTGLKEMLSKKCLSVQAQTLYHLCTPIDQRGEQTLNNDAKTADCVKMFSSDKNYVYKWTLNRSEQAKNTSALLEYANRKSKSEIHISLRPSQIKISEKLVKNIKAVISEEYIDPFDPSQDKEYLYNLSSGVPLHSEIANDILSIRTCGENAFTEFNKERLQSKNISFHQPIKRQKLKFFTNASKKLVATSTSKQRQDYLPGEGH